MSHLAEMGWVCLSVQYRVSPHHRWPSHITDVKTAIAWARANVDKFGGDRNFIAVAGCSAGGHLSALAGLTANDPEMQTDLPAGSDTSVDAVVGIYGRYDWEDRSTVEREQLRRLPRAGRGQAQNRAATPRCSATPRRSPGYTQSPAVLGDSRQRRHGDPGRSRRAASSSGSVGFPFGGQLRGVARRRARFRHDRRRAHRRDVDRGRAVSGPGLSQPDDRGQRGYLAAARL